MCTMIYQYKKINLPSKRIKFAFNIDILVSKLTNLLLRVEPNSVSSRVYKVDLLA